jgi:hypothetical protein
LNDVLAGLSYFIVLVAGGCAGYHFAMKQHQDCLDAAFSSGVECGRQQGFEEGRKRAIH